MTLCTVFENIMEAPRTVKVNDTEPGENVDGKVQGKAFILFNLSYLIPK